MNFKLIILHFNILEKYPPTMNFILDVLTKKPKYQISVFTSRNSSPYLNQHFENVKIWRFGTISINSLKRYLSYIIFNIFGSVILLIKRPDLVIVYETISIFPAFIYSKIYRNKKIHIHYHEYISLQEKNSSSRYMKFLCKLEKKLFNKHTFSHTNKERKALFLKENNILDSKSNFVYPNLPPSNWWSDYGRIKTQWSVGKIKLVYVGVLDADTMYLEEVLKWVKKNPEELELTFYSQQYNEKTRRLILRNESKNIFFKTAINYYDLPKELVKYHVGLVLYKGHIPNYIYNVPNKVFEYLACGMPVLADKALISLEKSNLEGVYLTELNKIEVFNIKAIISKSITFIQQKNGETENLYNYLFLEE